MDLAWSLLPIGVMLSFWFFIEMASKGEIGRERKPSEIFKFKSGSYVVVVGDRENDTIGVYAAFSSKELADEATEALKFYYDLFGYSDVIFHCINSIWVNNDILGTPYSIWLVKNQLHASGARRQLNNMNVEEDDALYNRIKAQNEVVLRKLVELREADKRISDVAYLFEQHRKDLERKV